MIILTKELKMSLNKHLKYSRELTESDKKKLKFRKK